MKPCEINVALALVNSWQLECDSLINDCEIEYKKLCNLYILNKNNSITSSQLEHNLALVFKSSELMNEINDITQSKLCILNTKSILLRMLRNQNHGIEEIDSSTINSYVHCKVMEQLITLLEEQEMYEECNLVNQKKINLFGKFAA